MLSYRHAFHAGNHADVLKHSVLCLILDSLNRKEKPYTVIDTHAGAGIYSLADERLLKTGEAKFGIQKILSLKEEGRIPSDVESLLGSYLSLAAQFARGGQYPGSPQIESRMMRAGDQLVLMELHNSEVEVLRSAMRDDFSGGGVRAQIHHRDGFAGLAGLAPPKIRRGLALCDPSYEEDGDFGSAAESICRALRKWRTGIFALWYPLLERRRAELALMKSRIISFAQAEVPDCAVSDIVLELPAESLRGARLLGSGMLVLNSPWMLKEKMEIVLPWLRNVL